MVNDGEITIGELARRLETIDRAMGQGFARIDRHLESMQFVHRETYAAERKALSEKLDAVEDKLKWISRTVAGSLVTAVIAAVVAIAARGGI